MSSRILATLALAHVGCAFGTPSTASVYRTSTSGGFVSTAKAGGGDDELLKSGLITLGVSYVSTVASGLIVQETMFGEFERMIGGEDTISLLWFPVLGAWAALIHNETTVRDGCSVGDVTASCGMVTVASGSIAFGAVAQTVGLGLTIAGFVNTNKGGTPATNGSPPRDRVVLVPGGPGEIGATLLGRF